MRILRHCVLGLAVVLIGHPAAAQTYQVSADDVNIGGSGGGSGNLWAPPETPIEATPASCVGYLESNLPSMMSITVWLKGPDGNYVDSETGAGWGYRVTVPLNTEIYKTGKYTCEATFWWNGDYLGNDQWDFHVNLRAVEFFLDAFIPADNVDHPFRSDRVYEGDDRPYWFTRFGNFRTRQSLRIIGPAATIYLVDDGPWGETGPSAVYETSSSIGSDGRLTAEARSDWTQGSPLKVDWGQASPNGLDCSVTKESRMVMNISCQGNSANPLVWSWGDWAASITYSFNIKLTFSGDQNVYYEVTGDHDGFPAYGIWAGDQLIYSYHHGSQTPWSLGPPMEMTAYRSGVLQ